MKILIPIEEDLPQEDECEYFVILIDGRMDVLTFFDLNDEEEKEYWRKTVAIWYKEVES